MAPDIGYLIGILAPVLANSRQRHLQPILQFYPWEFWQWIAIPLTDFGSCHQHLCDGFTVGLMVDRAMFASGILAVIEIGTNCRCHYRVITAGPCGADAFGGHVPVMAVGKPCQWLGGGWLFASCCT